MQSTFRSARDGCGPRTTAAPRPGGTAWTGAWARRWQPSRDPFVLSGSVGRFGDNRRDDLIKAQILLANAGYYDLPRPGAPTGWLSGEIVRAIRRYQKDQGLEPDGRILPFDEERGGIGRNGEGETLAALQGELGDRLTGRVAPTPEQVDAFYEARAKQRACEGEDAPVPPTPISLRGEDGSAEHPVGTVPANRPASVMSDVDPPQEQWKDGAQVARGGASGGPVLRPQPLPPPRPRPGPSYPVPLPSEPRQPSQIPIRPTDPMPPRPSWAQEKSCGGALLRRRRDDR